MKAKRFGAILATLVSAAACLSASAAWYDSPSIVKKVPLAVNASGTVDPHFMNKAEDDSLLLVNLQASGDNAPTVLIDMKALADKSTAVKDIAIRQPVAKPSDGYGAEWKGGAVSAKLGIALMGSGLSSETCAIATDGDGKWVKGVGLLPLSTSNGMKTDGLDFSADSSFVYSTEYEGGDRGKIAQWTYDKANGRLVFVKDFKTSLTRIRNISVYTVGGKELVYCGEGTGTSAAAKVVAIDVSGDTWTETVVSSGIAGLTGDITNVKLSNEDETNPVMYVLCDSGKLAVCRLASDGLSVSETVKTFDAAALHALAGGTTTAKFRNFEVTKDGKTAFLVNRIDAHNANLCVLATSAYIESDGTQFMNTGYYVGPQTKIEFDYAIANWAPTADYYQMRLLDNNASNKGGMQATVYVAGNADSGGSLGLAIGDRAAGASLGGVWTRSECTSGVKSEYCDSNRRMITIDEPNKLMSISENGEVVWTSQRTTAATMTAIWPLGIFGRPTNAQGRSCDYPARIRVYGLKIYEAGALVHDYAPVVKGGIVGLLDSKTGTFLYDTRYSGYGTFAPGGDIPTIDDDPYIESDGTSAINLGVVASPRLQIEVDFALTEIDPGAGNDYQQRIFGEDSDDKNPRISVYVNGSKNIAIAAGDGWNAASTGLQANFNRHKVIIDNLALRNAYMTGVTTNWYGYGSTVADLTKCATRPLALFGNTNDDGGTAFNRLTKAKVYGLKIWQDGTLVRDFAPRNIDGTAGFEDLVTGKFFTCDGLTASANVPTALSGRGGKGDAFIESDGSLYSVIDTRYFPSGKTKVEVDFQFARNAGSKDCLLGNYGSTYTVLVYAPNNGNFNLEARDNGHATLSFANAVKSDTARHTAVIDAPKAHAALYNAIGELQGEADFPVGWTHNNTANWPLTLFGSSTNAWGKTRQNAVARIFSLKISESDDNGATYTPVHTYTPCVKGGIPGFLDEVTGEFVSGGNLTAGGNVMEIDDDPYVESPDGGCFFDTGYYATSNTCVVCDFMLLEQQGNQQFPFEAGAASTGKSYMRMYGNGSSGTGDFAYALGQTGWQSLAVPYSPTVRHQVTLDALNCKAKVAVNGHTIREVTTAATGRQPEQSTGTLKIFSNYNMTKNTLKGRLYGFKIYEEGELVRDYVPICQGGTYALVDKVTGKTLEKASSSKDFTGSTANEALDDAFFSAEMRDEDAYIESDGSQAINLGYYTTPETRYEIDYQMTEIVGQMRPFGEAGGDLSAELYIQGSATGSGNVAFGVGNSWKAQTTGVGADLNRHVAVLDLANRECGYSGYKMFAFTSETVCSKTATNPIWIFAKGGGDGSHSNRAKMRLYAFRIYESGALVHEYLPYKNGKTVGLYDTMTGDVVTSTVSGNAFTYGGGHGYGKFAGEKTVLTTEPADDVSVKPRRTATLTAFAPGAVRYVWTRNGVVLAGATGSEVTVVWERPKAVGGTLVYGVTPVFLKDGVEVLGEEASAEVTMLPLGMVLILR